jgi:hypothetical protein
MIVAATSRPSSSMAATNRMACDGMTAGIWDAVGSRCLLAASSPPQSLETLAVRFCSRESAYELNKAGRWHHHAADHG